LKTEEQQRKEQSKPIRLKQEQTIIEEEIQDVTVCLVLDGKGNYPILRTIALSLIMGFFYIWVIPFLMLNDFLMNLSYPRADRCSILRDRKGIKIRWKIYRKRETLLHEIEIEDC